MTEAVVEATAPGFKDQALGVLQQLIGAVTEAGDFVKDEIPKVIRELLVFNAAKSVVFMFLALLIFGVGLYIYKRIYAVTHHPDSYSGNRGIEWIPLCIVSMISIPMFFSWLMEFLKITLAPRVWLLEYAANLVK